MTLTIEDHGDSYVTGQHYAFVARDTNDGNVLLQVNSLTNYGIRRANGDNFGAGEFVDGSLYFVVFDGLQFKSVGDSIASLGSDIYFVGHLLILLKVQMLATMTIDGFQGYETGQLFIFAAEVYEYWQC